MSDELLRELLAVAREQIAAVKEQTDVERQVLEQLQRSPAPAANTKPTRSAPDRRLHPLRHVERVLGIHRTALARHLALGHIAKVKVGNVWRVTQAELDRIQGEGLPSIEEQPAARARPRKRRDSATSERPGRGILEIPIRGG